MAQKRRYTPPNKRQASRLAPQTRSLQQSIYIGPRAPIVYGKPFMLMEDAEKNTFVFKAGTWVPHTASIAEVRQTCQVKELPQRVKGRIRYEIRCPEDTES